MSQENSRQEELQWQQCTLVISTERSTSHPIIGVPMILNPAISWANIMQQQSEYGRAPFHFRIVSPIHQTQTAILFQCICARGAAVAVSSVNTLDKVVFSILGSENATSILVGNAI